MGNNLGPNGLSRGCKVFSSRSMKTEMVAHKAYEPNTVVDLFDSEALAGKDS